VANKEYNHIYTMFQECKRGKTHLAKKMTRNTIGWDVLDLYSVGYNGFPDSEAIYILFSFCCSWIKNDGAVEGKR
jgi:hypothetical protein